MKIMVFTFFIGLLSMSQLQGAEQLFTIQASEYTQSISICSETSKKKETYLFNTPKSCLEIRTRKVSGAVTFVAEVEIGSIKGATEAIMSRPGCHNVLTLDRSGHFSYGIWSVAPRKYNNVTCSFPSISILQDSRCNY